MVTVRGHELRLVAAAGELVGAPAADVDRRVVGRHLLDRATELRQSGLDRVAVGRW